MHTTITSRDKIAKQLQMSSSDAGTPATSPPNSLTFRSESHDPSSPSKKVDVPPRKPKSLHGPRKPKITSFNFSSSEERKSPAPLSPRKVGPVDHEQEKMLDSIKARMGTLVFEGKTYQLTERDIENMGRIGNGITGEVFKIRHKSTNKVMAAKKMVWLDEPEERKRVLMDLHVMSHHKSPHIVQYYGSVIWNNEVWVFMELMATCLDRLLKKLHGPVPEDIVCKMAVSILKALDYLKTQHQVIHRDVKPSNMLLDKEGNVKLCDFGISGRLVDSLAFTRNAGCAGYMAPERINLQPSEKGYDVRADIWSLGISLVELANGCSPYAGQKFSNEFQLLTHIVKAPPPLPDKDQFSPLFFDFVSKCLAKEVCDRPYYPDLLQHPLIKEYESKDVDIGLWFRDVCTTIGPH